MMEPSAMRVVFLCPFCGGWRDEAHWRLAWQRSAWCPFSPVCGNDFWSCAVWVRNWRVAQAGTDDFPSSVLERCGLCKGPLTCVAFGFAFAAAFTFAFGLGEGLGLGPCPFLPMSQCLLLPHNHTVESGMSAVQVHAIHAEINSNTTATLIKS